MKERLPLALFSLQAKQHTAGVEADLEVVPELQH